jgi:hypothetical protein
MAKREKNKWSDLSPTQQKAIVFLGAAEAVVTAVAMTDLVRRDASQVRGSKALWASAFVVQPFGPIAYFLAGRK